MLKWLETKLIYPAPNPRVSDWDPDGPTWRDLKFDEVWIAGQQESKIHGWLFKHPNPRHVILFCHGNGEHVAFLGDELNFIRERLQATVLGFDYRGYGRSQGWPFEAGVLADGEAAQRWLADISGLRPEEIILWGRSLGGAVAVHLASHFGAASLLLDRTFSSLTDVAAAHVPWLPVRSLMRNQYRSVEKIRDYRGPLIQIHGHVDRVVPFRLGQDLYRACPSSDKRWLESEDLGHNDRWPTYFWDEIEASFPR